MQDTCDNILVWLPSPLGDAVLSTPALRAIRNRFCSAKITFLATAGVRDLLQPCAFNDAWLVPRQTGSVGIARLLRAYNFTCAVLLKNSYASALAVAAARIPIRVGYAREGRGFLLSEKLHPPKLPTGRYKPISMIDYYLALASWLGAETADRTLELHIDPGDRESLYAKLPKLRKSRGPLVILVPGGAFGPSKCWAALNFARTADNLIAEYDAMVVVSAAPNPTEKQIAAEICASARGNLLNLADHPLALGELKALFGLADLVITNDTGPRHIAIALGRKLITLFGPNDPAWTETDCPDEIKIIGNVPCAPCAKPTCSRKQKLCMESITVETVCAAAKQLLLNCKTTTTLFTQPRYRRLSESFLVDPRYEAALAKLGLTSTPAVFTFSAARNLAKSNLAPFRARLQFEIHPDESSSPTIAFLKRYDRPPVSIQLKNWFCHRARKSCAACEFTPTLELPAAGLDTPRVICYGCEWGRLFEKRSFIITEKIPHADALERKLPPCFAAPPTPENLKSRRYFIARLAAFVRRFHDTGYRHRDLYLSHIFCTDDGRFYLIDLARAFRPTLLAGRFLVKDLAQLHYSAPAGAFSNTDRLRFYLTYAAAGRLSPQHKVLIRKVIAKARRMARHDRKHGRSAPFAPVRC